MKIIYFFLFALFFIFYQPVHCKEIISQIDYENIVDLGTIPVSKPIKNTFHIPTDMEYVINTITTSCECVYILSYNKKLYPDQDNIVELLYLPDKIGDFAYEVTIMPVDSQKSVYTLIMMVSVIDDGLSPAKEIFPISSELLTRVINDPNMEYLIRASQAFKLLESSKATFIDIRQPADYDSVHIPGAINIPLYAIKTKPFLRSDPIILINNGTRRRYYESECALLRQKGFDAYILEGGLNLWLHWGYPLVGDYFAQQTLQYINPVDLFVDRHFKNWLIIDVSSSYKEGIDALPNTINIPVNENDSFEQTIRHYIRNLKTDALVSVVIISDTPEDYNKTMLVCSSIQNAQFYYVNGGRAAYNKFLQNQTLIKHPPQHARHKRKCKTCPQEEINKVTKK